MESPRRRGRRIADAGEEHGQFVGDGLVPSRLGRLRRKSGTGRDKPVPYEEKRSMVKGLHSLFHTRFPARRGRRVADAQGTRRGYCVGAGPLGEGVSPSHAPQGAVDRAACVCSPNLRACRRERGRDALAPKAPVFRYFSRNINALCILCHAREGILPSLQRLLTPTRWPQAPSRGTPRRCR